MQRRSPTPREDEQYDKWKAKVDEHVAKKCHGLTTDDLPDCDYHGMFTSGDTPKQAASTAIRMAREF